MEIKGCIWRDSIIEKLWRKHKVETFEVEELFNSQPYFRRLEKGHRKNEHFYIALGQTESGRYLITFLFISKTVAL